MVDGLAISLKGRFCRTARLHNEGYEFIGDVDQFIEAVRASDLRIDLLTFTQGIADPTPRYGFPREWDEFAVLQIETYEKWWTRQINDKTRNMMRKAEKKGVVLRTVTFDDELVRGIKAIYDESPVRQGKRFKHFGKDLETVRRDHVSFFERSDFIGAFLEDRLIGFVKLVHQRGWSSLMQIISLISQRDKAPTNALIAKSVELCVQKRVPLLQYGVWSRRSMGDFKEHHGFARYQVPRYYVPLSIAGKTALATGLHRPLLTRVPEHWIDRVVWLRAKWNSLRYRKPTVFGLSRGSNGRRA
jgi:hypothetical protein